MTGGTNDPLTVAAQELDPAALQRSLGVWGGMRERSVLIGRTGQERARLKIRPPLVFGDDHADLLPDALTGILRHDR